MNTEQQKQKCWMISLGMIPIPERWHRDVRPAEIVVEANMLRSDKSTHKQVIKKLRRGIIALLRRDDIETRDEAYEILKERNFLPIISCHKVMSWQRFYHYYAETRIKLGLKTHRNTKQDFIMQHYKTWPADYIADRIGSKPIYVMQTISKIKRGIIK